MGIFSLCMAAALPAFSDNVSRVKFQQMKTSQKIIEKKRFQVRSMLLKNQGDYSIRGDLDALNVSLTVLKNEKTNREMADERSSKTVDGIYVIENRKARDHLEAMANKYIRAMLSQGIQPMESDFFLQDLAASSRELGRELTSARSTESPVGARDSVHDAIRDRFDVVNIRL